LGTEHAIGLIKRRALEHLRLLGFSLKVRDGERVIFVGRLQVDGRDASVEFSISDWDFFALPDIRLLERPKWLNGQRSHLSANNTLCYVRREEVLVNPRNVEEIIDNCLAQAAHVLHDVAANKSSLVRDEEFFAHWTGGSHPFLTFFTIGSTEPLTVIVLKRDAPIGEQYLFTRNNKATLATCKALGWKTESLNAFVVHVSLKSPPAFAREGWPPRTVKATLNWLRAISLETDSAIRREFESADAVAAKVICVLIDCPLGHFGFWFSPDFTGVDRNYFVKRPNEFPNRLQKIEHLINRFVCEDISPTFIHGRNIADQNTLCGKKILLVGCGTIGGYIGTFLSRVGAGTEGGELAIVDKETLSSGNLGRHVLTLKDIHVSKSKALAKHIQDTFPYTEVVAHQCDVRLVAEINTYDLIVDATGSTIVSMWLNKQQQYALHTGAIFPALLYAWLEGQGEAAAAFLCDGKLHACYECLWVFEHGQPPRTRYPQLRDGTDRFRRPADCSSYMPFPVSASVECASLALKLALSWNSGTVKQRFLTRQLVEESTCKVKEKNPSKVFGCQACKT
jgi:hypothetical protein